MSTPIETKRDEFRRYLDESGVVASLTKALIRLYELEQKPVCAVSYVRQQMCENCPTEEMYDSLRFNYEESMEENVRKTKELTLMRDNLKRTPSDVDICLETGRLDLEQDENCTSLLKKHLTRDIFAALRTNRTKATGAFLLDCIQSGLSHHDAPIGLYAADAESYAVFADLFDPIIADLHVGFTAEQLHPTPSPNWGDPTQIAELDPASQYVCAIRLTASRNIENLPFQPKMSEQQYRDIMEQVRTVLENMEGDLKGRFHALVGMDEETEKQMRESRLLFDPRVDVALVEARVCRYWPQGRGVFVSDDCGLLVWVNADDHLRVMSMQPGGNIGCAYTRLVNAMQVLSENAAFARDPRLGFLTFSPLDLGSTLSASVLMRLPLLGANCDKMHEMATSLNLNVRGNAAAKDGGAPANSTAPALGEFEYDVSNKRRLGLTEFDVMQEMYTGVLALIQAEMDLGKEPAGEGAEVAPPPENPE